MKVYQTVLIMVAPDDYDETNVENILDEMEEHWQENWAPAERLRILRTKISEVSEIEPVRNSDHEYLEAEEYQEDWAVIEKYVDSEINGVILESVHKAMTSAPSYEAGRDLES
jgi:hypothetical protein